MSSILASQIDTIDTDKKERSGLKSTLREAASIMALFSVTAVIVFALSLSWVV
jgi:hypothetical protein